MDPSPSENPDFHDWAKVFVPYCSADLHAGTRKERSAALGGWFFAGHNLIAGAIAQLQRLPSSTTTVGVAPSHVLITGSSAGGIGALIHADWFAALWPRAHLKVSPEAGLFYPPVASVRDASRQRETAPSATGMHSEWRPFLHAGCAAAHNSSVAYCSNAHRVLEYVHAPLFLRENLYDVAKLANCGLDVHAKLRSSDVEYLRRWGQATRATIESRRSRRTDGFFAPSCLAHAANLRFASSPIVGGTRLIEAMHHWYFHADGASTQYAIDGCGELPCTTEIANASSSASGSRRRHEKCPLLDTVKACHSRCKLARRRRRIRLGLNPSFSGHNVCQLDETGETAGASTSEQNAPRGAKPFAGDVNAMRRDETSGGATAPDGPTAGTSPSSDWHDLDEEDAEPMLAHSGAGLAQLDVLDEAGDGGGGDGGEGGDGAGGSVRSRSRRRWRKGKRASPSVHARRRGAPQRQSVPERRTHE